MRICFFDSNIQKHSLRRGRFVRAEWSQLRHTIFCLESSVLKRTLFPLAATSRRCRLFPPCSFFCAGEGDISTQLLGSLFAVGFVLENCCGLVCYKACQCSEADTGAAEHVTYFNSELFPFRILRQVMRLCYSAQSAAPASRRVSTMSNEAFSCSRALFSCCVWRL